MVLDNLSTHTPAALYETFPAEEARRMLRRIECHYVPKHASWLNMVEIEIGVLASQCLDRRIESHSRLIAEAAAWPARLRRERWKADQSLPNVAPLPVILPDGVYFTPETTSP